MRKARFKPNRAKLLLTHSLSYCSNVAVLKFSCPVSF